jgi:hypothetical protein
MKQPETMPEPVKAGVERYARQHQGDDDGGPNAAELVAALKFDPMMGCYFFIRHGVFFGVELDGHVHT